MTNRSTSRITKICLVLLIELLFLSGISISTASFASNSANSSNIRSYIIIYGRDSCPNTSAMRKAFDGEGIQYQYKIIDKPTVQKNIYIKMKRRGLQTKEFTLPVVDVNNEILVHPSPTEVMDVYFFGSNTNE